jgi:hypothetical protein
MTLGVGGVGRLGAQSLIAIPSFAAVEFAFSNSNADASTFEVSVRTASGKEVASMLLPRDVVLGKFSGLPIGEYILAVTIKYLDGTVSSTAQSSFSVTESNVPPETPFPEPTRVVPTAVPTGSPTAPPPTVSTPKSGIKPPVILSRKGKTRAFCRIHQSLGAGKAFVLIEKKNGKNLRVKTRKGLTKKGYRTYVAFLKLPPKATFKAACQWLTKTQSLLGASRTYPKKK